MRNSSLKPVIFGIASSILLPEEVDFFKENRPLGYILFDRNIKNKAQLKQLVSDLKALDPHRDILILIDEEGGKVSRLKSLEEDIFKNPPALFFGNMVKDNVITKEIEEITYINYLSIAVKLKEFGINVVCAPVCDLLFDSGHDIIGSRAFGSNPDNVIKFARIVSKAFLDNGIIPIIKHIPGHGRAKVDSHEELPIVDTQLSELMITDFKVFKALSDMPMAMTAHVIFSVFDSKNPVTISKTAIKFIREEIGFKNIIISDDLSMKALSGSYMERARAALDAGCDIILHCNGNMQEMKEVVESLDYSLGQVPSLFTQVIKS